MAVIKARLEFNPYCMSHQMGSYRWLYVDNQHGYTYNIQFHDTFLLFFKKWVTIKCVESENQETAFNLCEDILEKLNTDNR